MKQNRHKFYRRQDCIKRFCNDLKELATEIINYEDKKNDNVNKQRSYSLWKSKSMSYMQRIVLLW